MFVICSSLASLSVKKGYRSFSGLFKSARLKVRLLRLSNFSKSFQISYFEFGSQICVGPAFPFLNDAEAKLSQFCSALHCCKIIFFSCFTVADKFVPVVWKTPRTAVPVRA